VYRVLLLSALFLAGLLLAGPVQSRADEDSKADVRQLIRQLDAPQLAERDAAEAELLRRGPAVLAELPPATDGMSAEVRQRLARVRQKLQRLASDMVADASTITLHADAMPLSKALAEFERQSGNSIVDYRKAFHQPATDPNLKVHFDKTPFWPALDQLLEWAGLTIYPYSERRAIYVVAATGKKRPAAGRICYRGPFRFEPINIVARRDLQISDDGTLTVMVEAIWEPRVRITSLLQRMADISAADERGTALPVSNRATQLEAPANGQTTTVKLFLPLRLPQRDVNQIADLKGKLTAMIQGKIETFRFSKLAEAKNVEQRIGGVTVTLEQVRKFETDSAKGHTKETNWEVRIKTRFDDAGDSLASHRTWIFDNEAYLEDSEGKREKYYTYETTAQSKNEVGVAYLFRPDKPIEAYTFVYKTPGSIITKSFEYELKDIPLP
jgi:hypothetical protein